MVWTRNVVDMIITAFQ